jgi:hypothetical protein
MTYTELCGTARGALAHQAAGESPCGWCLVAAPAARSRSGGVAGPPSPAPGTRTALMAPVTPVQAAVNRAVLAAEVEAFENNHRPASPLRLITGTETAA